MTPLLKRGIALGIVVASTVLVSCADVPGTMPGEGEPIEGEGEGSREGEYAEGSPEGEPQEGSGEGEPIIEGEPTPEGEGEPTEGEGEPEPERTDLPLTEENILNLQDRAEDEGWTFEVSLNPATEIPLDTLAGDLESELPDSRIADLFEKNEQPKGQFPAAFDWKELSNAPSVKNQGVCGSCWTFTTNTLTEFLIGIVDNVVPPDLSEQYLLSTNTYGWSCAGGNRAFDFYVDEQSSCDTVGTVLESNFPYEALDITPECPYPIKHLLNNWGYVSGLSPTVSQMKQALQYLGPLYVSLTADRAFQAYSGGIYNRAVATTATNHSVIITGWDDTQGNGVWLIQNSWGTGWGEEGYGRVEYNVANIGRSAAFATYDGGYAEPSTETFSKTFGGVLEDISYSVQQTSDLGYILAGLTESLGSGGTDAHLVKVDAFGNQEWERAFGGIGDDIALEVQQTSDGGYILAGSKWISSTNFDIFLIKTDSLGNTLWEKNFERIGENQASGNDQATSVKITSDGGYILAGWTDSFGAGSRDMLLIKTDSEGVEEWSKTFGGPENNKASSVEVTEDGGYILAGHSFRNGSNEACLVKTDSKGNEIWSRSFGGREDEMASSIQQTINGSFIIAGFVASFGAGSHDFYLFKTDSEGNLLWEKTFGGPGSDIANEVQITPDGGFILAGRTNSFGSGNFDFYLIKTDSEGNLLWEKTFGGSQNDIANSISLTADGGYIIAGSTESFGLVGYYDSNQILLIKTDAELNAPSVPSR